jgi:4-hydroxyisophthalate hydroxylase
VEDTCAGGREQYGAALILVRPDQFVAWAGDAPAIMVRDVLHKAAGFPAVDIPSAEA